MSTCVPRRWRISALTLSLLLIMGVCTAELATKHTLQIPTLTWKQCDISQDHRTECAQLPVPLSYRQPGGPKILLNIAKQGATDPAKRIGVLFVNPGGPGESAVSHLQRFSEVLGTAITSRFDIIAMDPRGIGEDSVARCWSTHPEPAVVDSAPSTARERRIWLAHNAYENKACTNSGHPIIDHISTANVARDMDLVRRALGEEKINYYGVSYGTVLGHTYAALFSNNIRAMALDGVVDPVAWTTGYGDSAQRVPVSVRTGAAAASLENLQAIIAACEQSGTARCPYAQTIRREWEQTVSLLQRGPVRVGDEENTLNSLTYSLVSLQYTPDDAEAVLRLVHDTYRAVVKKEKVEVTVPQPSEEPVGAPGMRLHSQLQPGLALPLRQGEPIEPTKRQPDEAQWWDTFTQQGPMCTDSVNPTDPQAWPRYADSSAGKQNPFTNVWLWNSSLCAQWPGQDKEVYRGPFDIAPAAALLIIGNTHDNATPLSNAQAVASMVQGARLLTVDVFGHTAADKNKCAARYLRAYLLEGKLPPEKTVCPADKPLF